MKEIPFRFEHSLLLVEARLWGPTAMRDLVLAVDTGTSVTTFLPEVMDRAGYSIRTAAGLTTVTTALGREQGYWRQVDRIEALGVQMTDFAVNVFDLHERAGIDGLLGLNFFLSLNVEFRFPEQVIRIHPV